MTATPNITRGATDRSPAVESTLLRAVVLLSGNLRSTALSQVIARSMLDLPVEPEMSLLRSWCDAVAELRGCQDGPLDYRVFVDERSPLPTSGRGDPTVEVGHDPVGYRGTGGVLRDVVGEYEDRDYVLVAFGPQVLREPLVELTEELIDQGDDVVFFRDSEGVPSGIMLVRVGAIRQIKPIGFVDFKEQALPQLANAYTVTGIDRPQAVSWPIRTLDDYIEALRWRHRDVAAAEQSDWPFAERWKPSFVLIENGAKVAEDAHLHDAVILSDATVGSKALVARSLVCSQAAVAAGRTVVDQIVRRRGHREDEA